MFKYFISYFIETAETFGIHNGIFELNAPIQNISDIQGLEKIISHQNNNQRSVLLSFQPLTRREDLH